MATVTVQYMRSAISDVYASRRWREEVNLMPDSQVIAVYHSFIERGVFERGIAKKKPQPAPKQEPTYKQLSFDDILKGGI